MYEREVWIMEQYLIKVRQEKHRYYSLRRHSYMEHTASELLRAVHENPNVAPTKIVSEFIMATQSAPDHLAYRIAHEIACDIEHKLWEDKKER